jgi:hypothetical protein
MTKNITLRMDEDLLRQLKHIAVEHDMSVSSWISKLAEDAAKREINFDRQKKEAWSVIGKTFHLGGEKFDREACYDRIH